MKTRYYQGNFDTPDGRILWEVFAHAGPIGRGDDGFFVGKYAGCVGSWRTREAAEADLRSWVRPESIAPKGGGAC